MRILGQFLNDGKKEDKNFILFNPSIAYYRTDRGINKFLGTVRKFRRYPKLHQEGEYDSIAYYNPNHPWLKGLQWESLYGDDTTGFFYFEYDPIGKTTKYKSILKTSYIFENGEKYDRYTFGQDARIMFLYNEPSTNNPIFIIIYNKSVDNNITIKNREKCEEGSGCYILAVRTVKIVNNKLQFSEETILCPEYSERVEKNWSLFRYQNKFYFSYGLTTGKDCGNGIAGQHLIFRFNTINFNCEGVVMRSYTPRLSLIECYYNNLVKLSVSAPALYLEKYGQFLGVGHMKYSYKKYMNMPSGSPIREFTENLLRKYSENEYEQHFHPYFIYTFFFYTFDKNSEINGLSNFYILPSPSEWYLNFVSGFSWTDDSKNNIILTYGDFDTFSKYMILPIGDILNSISLIDSNILAKNIRIEEVSYDDFQGLSNLPRYISTRDPNIIFK